MDANNADAPADNKPVEEAEANKPIEEAEANKDENMAGDGKFNN